MKNAGKACNNRLYRHIRTFEKIVKNYFVIYHKYVKIIQIISDLETGYSSNLFKHMKIDIFPVNR